MHRRVENRLALTPGYTYNQDGKYIQIYYQMHFYNVNEQLDYSSAYTDTTLTQHKWTMSPELHVLLSKDNWTRSLQFFYGIEFQTPDLFQKVNVLNDENPLVRRYGNPNLRGATNHRMQSASAAHGVRNASHTTSAADCASSAIRCRRDRPTMPK